MNERVSELEKTCTEILGQIKEGLGSTIDYDLEGWFSRLSSFENEENLNAQIAYDQTKYPAELCTNLMRRARLKSIPPMEQFRYIGRLNAKMKELLSLYPNINGAAARLDF